MYLLKQYLTVTEQMIIDAQTDVDAAQKTVSTQESVITELLQILAQSIVKSTQILLIVKKKTLKISHQKQSQQL